MFFLRVVSTPTPITAAGNDPGSYYDIHAAGFRRSVALRVNVFWRDSDFKQLVLGYRHVLRLGVVHSAGVPVVFVLLHSLFWVFRGAGSNGPASSDYLVESLMRYWSLQLLRSYIAKSRSLMMCRTYGKMSHFLPYTKSRLGAY